MRDALSVPTYAAKAGKAPNSFLICWSSWDGESAVVVIVNWPHAREARQAVVTAPSSLETRD